MRLIFLGLPGAGKGTQAALLADEESIPHISTGEMFRMAVQEHTPLGRKAKEYMDAGQLVPDEVTIGIVEERLAKSDCQAGFVLDGFPRTVPQARALDELLVRLGAGLDAAIYLQVPEEELIRRTTGRRICGRCAQVYNMYTRPPIRQDLCDQCGGELIQRDDDTEEKTRRRLIAQRDQLQDLLQYYENQGKLREVDGFQDFKRVRENIRQSVVLS